MYNLEAQTSYSLLINDILLQFSGTMNSTTTPFTEPEIARTIQVSSTAISIPEISSNSASATQHSAIAAVENHPSSSIQKWVTSQFEYQQIRDQPLPVASPGQEWGDEETLILAYINQFEMSKVRNAGKSKTLDLSAVHKRYHFLAKFRKLQDPSRAVYERAQLMITSRIDVLKRRGAWES
jgi:hypothetical protein